MALFTLPEYVRVLQGGFTGGWGMVGLVMISPIIVAVSCLVAWLIVGLAVRGSTGGRIGFKVVGQGVLLSIPVQFVLLMGLALCPSRGGC